MATFKGVPGLEAAGVLATIAGAWVFEYFGYLPCELCLKQRWAYYAGVPLALVVGVLAPRNVALARAGLALLCLLWLATAFTTKYSSLSALVAAFLTPIFLWWFSHPALASLFAVLTLLLFWMHRENIKRKLGIADAASLLRHAAGGADQLVHALRR